MNVEIELVDVQEHAMAAVRRRMAFADIPAKIFPLMDKVWAFIRSRGLADHGHNVWLYRPRGDGEVEVDVGVQLAAPFAADANADVACLRTPAGKVAHAVHYGDYAKLPRVFDAVLAWCAANGHAVAGVNWEVYGDWHDDVAKRRTDVYVLVDQ